MLMVAIGLWRFDRAVYFRALNAWGVPALDHPFMDLKNVSAAIECSRKGIDVYRFNPCDPMGRIFPYSRLWLDVGRWLPNHWDSFAAGIGLGIAYLGSIWLVSRPQTWRQSAAILLAVTSTASVYAVERANADLLIFVLIAATATLLQGDFRSRLRGYVLILLGGLLKFYPLAAFAIALRESPRRLIAIALCAVLALAALLFSMRGDLSALSADIPGGRYGSDSFGAMNIFYLIQEITPSILMLIVAAGVLLVSGMISVIPIVRNEQLSNAFLRLTQRDRANLVLGTALIVGCFFSGQSIIYRAIFLIPIVAGLQTLQAEVGGKGLRSRLSCLIGAAIILMWDGAIHDFLYPGRLIPAFYLLLREALWWWFVASLCGILAIFALTSTAFALVRPWFVGRLDAGGRAPLS
jgi:hypothetical protein